jgi:hypothetical protein
MKAREHRGDILDEYTEEEMIMLIEEVNDE